MAFQRGRRALGYSEREVVHLYARGVDSAGRRCAQRWKGGKSSVSAAAGRCPHTALQAPRDGETGRGGSS